MLAYDEIGGAGEATPVVLVPGLASRRLWDPLLPRWPDGLRAIRVDYPGFGRSAPTDPPTPAAVAREVIALLDRLGIERAPVAGLSLGGWVALEVAKAGRTSGVLAMAPAGLWRRRSPLLTDLQLNAGMGAGRITPTRLQHAGMRTRLGRRLSLAAQSARPADVDPAWAIALLEDGAASPHWRPLFLATRRERFTGGAAVEVPVRVVWGDRDRIALRTKSRNGDELPAHAVVETWEGCGHVLPWDAPERVMRAIADLGRA